MTWDRETVILTAAIIAAVVSIGNAVINYVIFRNSISNELKNTLISEKLKWISFLREHCSDALATAYQFHYENAHGSVTPDTQQAYSKTRMRMYMHLNQNNENEARILDSFGEVMAQVRAIPKELASKEIVIIDDSNFLSSIQTVINREHDAIQELCRQRFK